jgi:2'-5' RNA ligase
MAKTTQLVIVAIPSDDDPVWKFSSEKVPHITLLYLGSPDFSPEEFQHVTEYVQHASSQLTRFGLDVDRRGVLGDKSADVLFFSKGWSLKDLAQFRSNLLQDDLISTAYHSVDQFPEWTPHLTMGFPDTPAKKDNADYNRFSWVRFDKIALWDDDSTGPTFELKSDERGLEVAMSQLDIGRKAVEEIFHSGVKGMKWGVRKDRPSASSGGSPQKVHVEQKGTKLKTTGGAGHKPHVQAVEKVVAQQIARKSGVHALSNKELQDVVTRMNLEQQFVRLSPQSKKQKASKFVAETLLGVGKQQVSRVANDVAAQQVAKAMNRTK